MSVNKAGEKVKNVNFQAFQTSANNSTSNAIRQKLADIPITCV